MNFGRVIRVEISRQGITKVFSYDKFDDSAFEIGFNIPFGKTGTFGKIHLTNISADTLELCQMKNEKYSEVKIFAGYDGKSEIIFFGKIFSVKTNQDNPDNITTLTTFNEFTLFSLCEGFTTFTKQKTSRIISQILSANQVVKFSIQLENDRLLENFTASGTVKQTLDRLMSLSDSFYYPENDKLIFLGNKMKKSRIEIDTIYDRVEISENLYKAKIPLTPKLLCSEILNFNYSNLDEDKMNSDFKLIEGRHIGSSTGKDFQTEIYCEKI